MCRGHKTHCSDKCGLNKTFSNNILRQSQSPAIITSADAVQCYDCIVHLIANINMRQHNADPASSKAMLMTLEEMEHFISTACGSSNTPYWSKDLLFKAFFKKTVWDLIAFSPCPFLACECLERKVLASIQLMSSL